MFNWLNKRSFFEQQKLIQQNFMAIEGLAMSILISSESGDFFGRDIQRDLRYLFCLEKGSPSLLEREFSTILKPVELEVILALRAYWMVTYEFAQSGGWDNLKEPSETQPLFEINRALRSLFLKYDTEHKWTRKSFDDQFQPILGWKEWFNFNHPKN